MICAYPITKQNVYTQKSIKFMKIWNDIALQIRTLPFNNFKQKYKLYLIQKSATSQN